MTIDRPLWLFVLVALPVLWWLHRRLRAPREVVVASVDALRGAEREATGRRPDRAVDTDLALLAGAVLLLALSAAGPRFGAGAPAVLVAVDTSASMLDRVASGETLADRAWDGASAALMQLATDVDVVLVDLDAPQSARRAAVGAASPPAASPSRADDLPRSLAPVLARARADGFPGILLVTDRVLPSRPDVVVAGPGAPPVPRPGVLGAVLDGDAALVSILWTAAEEGALVVTGDGTPEHAIAVEPGAGERVVRVPAPPRESGGTYSLRTPDGDVVASLAVVRTGGVATARMSGPFTRAARLRTLLGTVGIEVVSDPVADVDVVVRHGGPPEVPDGDAPPVLHIAAAAGRDGLLEVSGRPELIAADVVTCGGVLAAAVPTPGVRVVTTGRLAVLDGRPLGEWTVGADEGAAGYLAVALPRRVVTTLDPEAPGCEWSGDPSFPVFVLAALEHLAGGPDRLEVVDGVPRGEIVRESPPPPAVAVADVTPLVRPASADPASSAAAGLLALAATVLLAFFLLRETVRLRAGRFSSAARR